jgi:hypothetical protein
VFEHEDKLVLAAVQRGHAAIVLDPDAEVFQLVIDAAAWQGDLEALLRRVAHDYDEVADDLEAGRTEIRHNELIRE